MNAVSSSVYPAYRQGLFLALVCGMSTALAYLSDEQLGLSHALYVCAYLAGSWRALRKSLPKLGAGEVNIDFLMLFVAMGAAVIDAHLEGAILLFLFSLSSALEEFAEHRTRKEISRLYEAHAKSALKLINGAWVPTAVELIRRDDLLLVKPGELFPADGELAEGQTTADESALTGEAAPVEKISGSTVYGGTLNQAGQAVIRVTRLPQESAVQKVIRLIETARKQKAPSQRFTDIIGKYYTRIILGGSLLFFAVLVGLLEFGPTAALYRTMVLLVVASPCALVLSVPSAILTAIASGARNGVLFKGGVAVEKLASINHVAFDKTGTITKGSLEVDRVQIFNGISEEQLLGIAASIEHLSTHPLAHAVVREAQHRGIPLVEVSELQNSPGLGMEAVVAGRKVLVGSSRFLQERGISVDINLDGSAPQVLLAERKLLGAITLRDELRADARTTISRLRRSIGGLSLLSGDRPTAAAQVARQVDIEDFRAGLSPADKLCEVKNLQRSGKKVAMVGDGINDSPSLAAADVAVVMGDRGSDTALEQADVVLMGGRISALPWAFQLSKRARRIIFQNVAISLGVVCLLVGSALSQSINLSMGVLAHEGSTVIVVLNSLRLLKTKPGGQRSAAP